MFASRLKALRVGKGLTQADFSRMFHVASGTIAMWETGKRTPDLDTLRKIAVFFGVSTDYLLDCHGEFAAYLRQYYDSDTANDFAQKCGIDVSLLNHLNSTQTDVTPRSPSHSQATFGTDDIKQIAKAIEVDYKYLACLYDGYDPCSVRDVTIPENDLMRTAPTTVGRSLLDVNLDIFDGGDEKNASPVLSEEALEIGQAYDRATLKDRNTVRAALDDQLRVCEKIAALDGELPFQRSVDIEITGDETKIP